MKHQQRLTSLVAPATTDKSLLPHVIALKKKLATIEALPPARAAEILGVDVRTIYRRLETGDLERVPRQGRAWVSVRSLVALLENHYGPTAQFNALQTLEHLLRQS